ncbi:lachrymatory-factor synthase [Quercus suber]|uniref:Lachrymatory-factor synthase n=1 Tax=Quercus suber TaxID=58331 RepID=A0AAW0KX43_QUESU
MVNRRLYPCEKTISQQKIIAHSLNMNWKWEMGNGKWSGSVGGIVGAPIDKVWTMVSQTKKLPEWMQMVEQCTDLVGEDGMPGYVRLVSGFMFPQQDGERSWNKERLVCMDSSSHSYVYRMEASNIGLDRSLNSLKLVDYGDDSTLDFCINLALTELRVLLKQHSNKVEKCDLCGHLTYVMNSTCICVCCGKMSTSQMFCHLMETLELHLVILYLALQEMSRQFKSNQSEGVLEERNSKSISVRLCS